MCSYLCVPSVWCLVISMEKVSGCGSYYFDPESILDPCTDKTAKAAKVAFVSRFIYLILIYS